MTGAAWLLLTLAAVLAVGDWVAVARRNKPLEYACKPAVILALIGVALTLHPVVEAQRTWVLVALGFGLVGDVCLALPVNAFLAGLSAFLVGHLAYIAGFAARGVRPLPILLSLAVVLPGAALLGSPIFKALAQRQRRLLLPVGVYGGAVGTMLAVATGAPGHLAMGGALGFWFSDLMIGWDRFVRPGPPGRKVQIIVLYHVGQAALTVSLALRI